MKKIGVLNPEKIDENNTEGWRCRKAARAVVFNKNSEVGLLYVSKYNYYKLPGGGVEENEDIQSALKRECSEELGVSIELKEEIGFITEYRPLNKLKQDSFCFIAIVVGEPKETAFTEKEEREGFNPVWVLPEKGLQLLGESSSIDYDGKFIEKRDLIFLTEALGKN
jgi:8-oxo-dGTP pyrophosphatase MutT (NUDIX family)